MSPLHVGVVALAGWINREQQKVIDDLKEQSRVLRERLGSKRPRFTDDQRRRLAVKGKVLGRKSLAELGSMVTPDTMLRWYRELIATKYDGSRKRGQADQSGASECPGRTFYVRTGRPSRPATSSLRRSRPAGG